MNTLDDRAFSPMTQPDIDLDDRYDFYPIDFPEDETDPYDKPWDESEVSLIPSRSTISCDVTEIKTAINKRLGTQK